MINPGKLMSCGQFGRQTMDLTTVDHFKITNKLPNTFIISGETTKLPVFNLNIHFIKLLHYLYELF